MAWFTRFSKRIEDQNWDHVRFLRNMLLLLGIIILMFYLWVFFLNLQGLVNQEFFVASIKMMLLGHSIGLGSGILLNVLLLLPPYRMQEWDLHVVIPRGLFYHLLTAIGILILSWISTKLSAVFETAFLTGFLMGGLIALLAYSGEVQKEHITDHDPFGQDDED